MNRATLVRGIQLIVGITLATFAFLLYQGVESRQADLAEGFAHIRPLWLVVAAALALQEGVCGGLRMFVRRGASCPWATTDRPLLRRAPPPHEERGRAVVLR